MKLSTGKVAFEMEFDNGDKQYIYFNPNDRGIQERIQNFETTIDKRIKDINLEKYRSSFENTMSKAFNIDNPEELLEMSDEDLKILQERLKAVNSIEDEYNKAVCDELDEIFDSKISDIAFKYCQPFDTVVSTDDNGVTKNELYVMHFLNWLMVELKKHGETSKTAIDKHLAKYSK